MFRCKTGEALLGTLMLAGVIGLAGCPGGDTDGSVASDDAAVGTQFVGDGGAGASLSLVVPASLATGATSGFSVTALDPSGAPLEFVRLFCETERGIALLEPSAGGTGFESTNANGFMSGVLGCTTPGSFIIECRAPDGFGLTVRDQIVCRGDVPEGFGGFPGAAGGNLGGQLIVDETPQDETDGGLSISQVLLADGLNEASVTTPIDTGFNTDCDGDPDTIDPETFTDTIITLQVTNDTTRRVSIGTMTFTIQDGRPGATFTQPVTVEIAPGATGNVIGFLTSFDAGKSYVGTGLALINGTFRVDVVMTGVDDSGDAFTLTDSFSITLFNVNNC